MKAPGGYLVAADGCSLARAHTQSRVRVLGALQVGADGLGGRTSDLFIVLQVGTDGLVRSIHVPEPKQGPGGGNGDRVGSGGQGQGAASGSKSGQAVHEKDDEL